MEIDWFSRRFSSLIFITRSFSISNVTDKCRFQWPVNLSIAVWVGFLALFGIATDDGVLMGTYLTQRFSGEEKPATIKAIRAATLEAATRRNRPAMMTTATTLLALLPILTSTGRGSDVMVPMAIPAFGGMAVAILTVFVVPTLYCWIHEIRCRNHTRQPNQSDP